MEKEYIHEITRLDSMPEFRQGFQPVFDRDVLPTVQRKCSVNQESQLIFTTKTFPYLSGL